MPDGGVFEEQRINQDGDSQGQGKIPVYPNSPDKNPLCQTEKEREENSFAVFEVLDQIFQKPFEESGEKMEARTFVLESREEQTQVSGEVFRNGYCSPH
jgi:hypothetical protein